MPRRISTARGREFGDGLRAVIGAAGLSSRAVAEIVGWHESKLSSLVRGRGGATELEVAILLGACRTPLPEREHLLKLFRETDVKGWWQQYGARSPVRLRTAVGHLAVAESMVSWHTHAVPCFLQTERYAREVTRGLVNVPAEELEERVAAQAELHGLASRIPRCTFYVHELALLRRVGGRDVHIEQLHRLGFLANRPRFTFRIVPVEAGVHAGMNGPFTMLDFRDPQSLVWLQNENCSLFIEEELAVDCYRTVVQRLDEVSLDMDQSKAAIARMVEGMS